MKSASLLGGGARSGDYTLPFQIYKFRNFSPDIKKKAPADDQLWVPPVRTSFDTNLMQAAAAPGLMNGHGPGERHWQAVIWRGAVLGAPSHQPAACSRLQGFTLFDSHSGSIVKILLVILTSISTTLRIVDIGFSLSRLCCCPGWRRL